MGCEQPRAHDEPKLDGELLAAGERLRDDAAAGAGGKAKPDEVAEASAAERDAIRALLAAARKRLGERAHLGAARPARPDAACRRGRSGRAAQLLERGRLTDELKAVGFGPLEAVKPARADERRGRPRRARARDSLASRGAAPRRRGAGSRARARGSRARPARRSAKRRRRSAPTRRAPQQSSAKPRTRCAIAAKREPPA